MTPLYSVGTRAVSNSENIMAFSYSMGFSCNLEKADLTIVDEQSHNATFT